MAWSYEIRSSNNAVLKRDGGFPTQDAAKVAGRKDAKKMKNLRQPDKPDVGRIMVVRIRRSPRGIDSSFVSWHSPVRFRLSLKASFPGFGNIPVYEGRLEGRGVLIRPDEKR
jgi:hypothetical protein